MVFLSFLTQRVNLFDFIDDFFSFYRDVRYYLLEVFNFEDKNVHNTKVNLT